MTPFLTALAASASPKAQIAKGPVPPLMDFIPQTTPGYTKPLHLQPFVDALEGIQTKPLRLLCSVSPRHGKTDTLIRWFVWLLRRNPRIRLAYLTFGDAMAKKKSRECRSLARDMGVELADDSQAVGEWSTKEGGGLFATGREGGITGRGFDVIVFDDPYKNHEEADSDIVRESVYDLWTGSTRSRLEPGGSVVVNAARWRHDDLIGELSKDGSYRVINLPAMNDKEEPLWPERWSREALMQVKHDVPSRIWTGQFLGKPSPDAGGMFARSWFGKRWKPQPGAPKPPCDFVLIAVDGAWLESVSSDYSACAVWGFNRTLMQYYLLDLWRGRVQSPDLIHKIRDMGLAHRVDLVLIEAAASGIAAIQMLKQAAIPGISDRVEGSKPLGSKEARAESITPLCANGAVWLPEQHQAIGDWVEEHCQFPTGAHDDYVDTTSMALRRLSDPVGTRKPSRGQAMVSPYAR